MKNILMTCLSVCSLGVSCNEKIDAPMLLVVGRLNDFLQLLRSLCTIAHWKGLVPKV